MKAGIITLVIIILLGGGIFALTKIKADADASAATTASNGAASLEATDKAEETVSAEDGNYTYVEYEGESVPYYRGYYYISGVWVWHGRGTAPFPPPNFRPVVRSPQPAAANAAVPAKAVSAKATQSLTTPAKTTSTKAAPAKATSAKSTPAKAAPAKSAPRRSGGHAPARGGAPR